MTHSAYYLTRLVLALAVVVGLAACAPVDRAETEAEADAMLESLETSLACFNQRDIRGYSNAPGPRAGGERLVLDAGSRGDFVVETLGVCPNLDGALRITFDTRVGTRSCTGNIEDLTVVTSIPDELAHCPVRVLGRLPEEG